MQRKSRRRRKAVFRGRARAAASRARWAQCRPIPWLRRKPPYHKAPVVLTGKIVERVGGTDDKYIFQDETGKLMVDIDHKVFAGRDIGPQTKVRLFGKVKKSAKKPLRVDVRVLQLLPQ